MASWATSMTSCCNSSDMSALLIWASSFSLATGDVFPAAGLVSSPAIMIVYLGNVKRGKCGWIVDG